jgi:putative ATPase
MTRFAVEDVGLADPNALRRALDAWEAYERLGSPEGDLALVQAAIYLALAPKSDAAYQALKAVKRTLSDGPMDPVPAQLRNAPTKLMKDIGYGEGYDHAHEHDDGIGRMECLPDALAGTRFYQPTERGVEKRFKDRLEEIERIRSGG